MPHLGGLARMLVRLGAAARRQDLVYANSQKAFVLAAPACAAARRRLVWHLHDILSPHDYRLAITGIMAGALAQVPLAAISSSEIGVLFWSLAAIGAAAGPPPGRAVRAHLPQP